MKRVLAQAYLPPAKPPMPTCSSPKDLSKAIDQVFLFPPPNVTGKLHMGHALTVTIQDSAVRFQRLLGKQVRWVFGTDHAGIATQTVVEKQLFKQINPKTGLPVTRHDLGREKFIDEVKEWTRVHKGKISNQLKLLGATLDYNREYFTLDDFHSEAVEQAFIRLHSNGLLHRKLRMVNYCYQLETCLSDLEVDQIQFTEPADYKLPGGETCRLGVADDFAYRLVGGSEEEDELVVRTTRLETMWGDVAVGVHPEDPRWSKYIGRKVQHPFLPNVQLPVIGDSTLVAMDIGTGAVKITPFHDESDFDCAQRNGLPLGTNLYNDKGRMNQFSSSQQEPTLSRFEMRAKLREELAKLGLYRGQVAHPMTVPVCSRTGDVIERTLKHQWFLDAQAMSQRANALSQDMTFSPAESEHVFRDWLQRCGDWCVSRQLWWGHRIPAYRVRGTGEDKWIVCKSLQDARLMLGTEDVEQDEDVLDTWFSSGLLPLSVNGWPHAYSNEQGKPLLTWMETGSDILFFWVARMCMLSAELENVLPFPHVHLHSLVRDSRGRKMSKSLGNVIDPMDVIQGVTFEDLCAEIERGNLTKREQATALLETKQNFPNGIPAYGSDALRLALAGYASSQTITFDISSVAAARLFCNKLWQAGRFVAHRLDQQSSNGGEEESLADKWIAQRLHKAHETCTRAYAAMDCDLASRTAHKFILEDFCDVYIECNKLHANNALLLSVFQCSLTLLNPVMPNITQDLWDHFFPQSELMWQATAGKREEDLQVEQDMNTCLDICRAVRALKQRYPNQREFKLVLLQKQCSAEVMDLARRLTRVDALQLAANEAGEAGAMVEPLGEARGYVEAVGSGKQSEADLAKEQQRKRDEMERISKRQTVLRKELDSLEKRLASPAFVSRAPPAVLEKEKKKLLDCQNELDVLENAKKLC